MKIKIKKKKKKQAIIVPKKDIGLQLHGILAGEYSSAVADQIVSIGNSLGDNRDDYFYKFIDTLLESNDISEALDVVIDRFDNPYKYQPVDIRKFITSEFYLGLSGQVYPEVLKCVTELNSGNYVEAVLTGAIGTAKTTIALWTTAYQLYLLSCLRAPQEHFGLDHSSEILFVFQSITKELAKALNYARFKALIDGSPYFQKYFKYDKGIESELNFPNHIYVKPVSGSDTAAIGQNVIGGVIDELNFMAKIDKSRASVDGGVYDQAIAVYNSISRRRKSRFMTKGKLPGVLCLVSSKKYPGQFTDTKFDEAKKEIEKYGFTTIYLYDKTTWDVLPKENFTGEWFKVFIGDLTRKPFVIEDEADMEGLPDNLIKDIPMEYKTEFENDIMNALRDIAGVSTLATMPFITNLDKLAEAFKPNLKSIFSVDECDFKYHGLGLNNKVIENMDRSFYRFAHVDLGLTSDAAGVCIGHVNKFKEIEIDGDGVMMPNVVIDGLLRVKPPANGEINFEKIRKIFYMLLKMGVPLRWITFDSYQSVDSIQILRGKGFFTGTQSMDRTTVPYDLTKTSIIENRLSIIDNDFLHTELARLERTDKGKIDHPSNGTKDLADALAGVVYGLTMQSAIWAMHGQNPVGLLGEQTNDLEETSNKKAEYS